MKALINYVAFQVGWFACVLGAAHGMSWLGPVVVLMVVLIHLGLAAGPIAELRLIGIAMALGAVVDSLLLAPGWFTYAGNSWPAMLAPYWIICMWGLFATTLNASMSWLKNRPFLAFLLGAVGGPLSYLGGQKLGAMTFNNPALALTALAVAWGLSMPLLAWLAGRFNGITGTAHGRPDQPRWQVSNHA